MLRARHRLFLHDTTVAFGGERDPVCHYCSPGDEYLDVGRQACLPCTLILELQCPSDSVHVLCSSTRDSYCRSLRANAMEISGMCGNGVHDFGEQCDESAASSSQLSKCCQPASCLLDPGVYSDPPCSTFCGGTGSALGSSSVMALATPSATH